MILLAGEALSKTHYSTLHGAYESGIAQATKIVQYFSISTTPHSTTSSSSVAAKDSVKQNGYLKKTSKRSDENQTENFKTNVLASKNDILKVS